MLRTFNAHLNELEARAEKDNHFVDYQHLAATKEYSAVMCTVSSKNGKRVCRMAGNSDITIAQEEAGYMALCAFYGETMKTGTGTQTTSEKQQTSANQNTQPVTPPANKQNVAQTTQQRATVAEPANAGQTHQKPTASTQRPTPTQQRPAAGQQTQGRPTGSAPVTPTGRQQTRPATGQNAPSGNGQMNQTRPANTNPSAQRPTTSTQRPGPTQQRPTGTAPANPTAQANTNPSQAGQPSVAADGHAPDDFRVMIGNFKHSENNWISSLVQNPETLQVLRNISDIANPVTESMREPIKQVRQYLTNHRLL